MRARAVAVALALLGAAGAQECPGGGGGCGAGAGEEEVAMLQTKADASSLATAVNETNSTETPTPTLSPYDVCLETCMYSCQQIACISVNAGSPMGMCNEGECQEDGTCVEAPADDSAAPGLRPAPHALRLRPGFGWRAWYGVMLLPPEDALVRGGDEDVGAAQTFGEMWSAARTAVSRQHDRQLSAEVPALGCGKGRLLTDQTGSCPDGEMECWMTCMSITHLQGCSGGTWRPSGVGNLAEWVGLSIQCVDTTSGAKWPDQTGEMCFTCGPQCELSDAAAAPSAPHGGPAAPLEQFCRTTFMGTGVTMYMDGFKMTSASPDETCVAFLLPSLVIDESWKLVLACLGVVLLSASVEVCSLGRRYLPKQRQGDVGIIFHMVSLVLAYFAMLFVMTYSVELFLSVIVGLAVGHKVAATVGRSQALDHGAGSPCCRLAAGLEASTDPRAVAAEPGPTGDAEGLVTVRLAVKGMTCGACVETVRRALAGVEGAHSATVSLQDASAEVLCKPSSTIAHRLCEACSCIGFDAQAANRRL